MTNLKRAFSDATWHCEPHEWSLDKDGLTLVTGENTDFWQSTFYGFRHDNGHFLGAAAKGNFTASVVFDATYDVLYDQAGMMMRIDENNWVKTGVEFSDDVTNFSTVITRNGRSDWSVVGVPAVSGPQAVRLTRSGAAIVTHFKASNGTWSLMRVADFAEADVVRIGPMACSPQRSGLRARFLDFSIGPVIEKPLHDDQEY